MNVFSSILLILVAILLSVILLPIAFIYSILVMIITRSKSVVWSTYFCRIAKELDKLGNIAGEHLFNDTLIYKNKGYKFGRIGETISSALGKNVKLNTLTLSGKMLNKLLNLIQKNHSILSIEEHD